MLNVRTLSSAALLLCLVASAHPVAAAEGSADPGHAQRRPKRFAIIFNMGYGGDAMPQDKEAFEKLVVACKQAHYNVILCKYEDWRGDICRKHDMQIMVNLLDAAHHVYHNVEGAKALCEKLRGNDVVYAYHLWSDRGPIPGRNRDIANVHQWDPTHANYVGTYRLAGNGALVNPDLHGYYDFHWKRGGLWPHLQGASQVSRAKDAFFLCYMQSDPGLINRGNPNRVQYTIAQSMAFGLKGYLLHYRAGTMDTGTWQWGPLGQDLAKANAEFAPLGPEVMKLGNPTAVYSTTTTMDAKNKPVGAAVIPAPLQAVPADFWLKVETGEAVLGVYKDDQGRDAVFFANHNSYAPQKMKLRLAAPGKSIELFNRKAAQWEKLTEADNTVSFELPGGCAELIRALR